MIRGPVYRLPHSRSRPVRGHGVMVACLTWLVVVGIARAVRQGSPLGAQALILSRSAVIAHGGCIVRAPLYHQDTILIVECDVRNQEMFRLPTFSLCLRGLRDARRCVATHPSRWGARIKVMETRVGFAPFQLPLNGRVSIRAPHRSPSHRQRSAKDSQNRTDEETPIAEEAQNREDEDQQPPR